MSKTEILAELAQLSRADLDDVRAWLDQQARKDLSPSIASKTARIYSPRLAERHQAVDFIKHVTEIPRNATV